MSNTPKPDEFDPYGEWLGIPPGPRPPSPEALLGLPPGETDKERILDAGARQKERLDEFMLGKQNELAAELTREVAGAVSLLLQHAEALEAQPTSASAAVESTASAKEQSIPTDLRVEQSGDEGPGPASLPPPLAPIEPVPISAPRVAAVPPVASAPTAALRPELAPADVVLSRRLPDRLPGLARGEKNAVRRTILRILAAGVGTMLVGVAAALIAIYFAAPVGDAIPKESSALVPESLRLRQIERQTVEAGRQLTVVVSVEDAIRSEGTLRFSLGANAPAGARIDPRSGTFTWTPAESQHPGDYDVAVLVESSEGHRFLTSFTITVTKPTPLHLQPIAAQTVEVGKQLTIPVAVGDAGSWQGKLRFGLGPAPPAGATIDPTSGIFTWTPTGDQGPGKHDIVVSVDTPEGRRDETTFSVTVTKSTPLRLQPIAPQTVEAGKALTFAVSVEDAKRWEGKLRFSLPSNAPAGAGIDPETGAFTLAPAANLAPGTYDLSVSVEGPENRRDQITFAVTVTRPSPAPPVTGPDYSTQGGIALDLGGGVTMELVLIRPGSFEMGSGYPRWPTFGDPYPQDEEPRHTVTITNPFYLGKYEVTQDQWKAVMGTSPSRFKRPKNPVEQVSWEDCQQFLKTMQEKLGTSAGRFRLPTEAEWEYACRAGSRTDYSFGNNEADLREHAWCVGTSLKKTNAVGQKQPNAWGLYDMHGNVWEWCADWYSRYYYGEMTNLSPTKDPSGPTRGSTRVLRGGSWNYDASNCRSARRFWGTPTLRNYACGFRVVCSR